MNLKVFLVNVFLKVKDVYVFLRHLCFIFGGTLYLVPCPIFKLFFLTSHFLSSLYILDINLSEDIIGIFPILYDSSCSMVSFAIQSFLVS